MFAVIERGPLVCEHCGGEVAPIKQLRAASWGSPDVWEYECCRCGALYFSGVDPCDVPLVPQLDVVDAAPQEGQAR